MSEASHPSAKELSDFGLGKLLSPNADGVAAHLDSCAECQQKLAEQQPDSFVVRVRAAAPKDGSRSGTALPSACKLPPTKRPVPADFPAELAAMRKFEVLGKLGEGGMGAVWKVRHRFLDQVVALKVMSNVALGNADARDRFFAEMAAGGKLNHPNVVRTIDAAKAGDVLYLVMEYVESTSLDKLVEQKGPLPVGFVCRSMSQAAEGLQHAHEKGMVNRDIKPHNLLVTKAKQIKVMDFGLVRMEQEGGERRTEFQAFLGTPSYVAPEQAQNAREADIRSDIYSLGCTMYFLLSGRPPFRGQSAMEVAMAHINQEPTPLVNIPQELWAVIARMMAKRREERYQTPAEVVEALRPFTAKPQSSESIGPVRMVVPAVSVSAPTPPPVPTSAFANLSVSNAVKEPCPRTKQGVPMWVVVGGGLVAIAGMVFVMILITSNKPQRHSSEDTTVAGTPVPTSLPISPIQSKSGENRTEQKEEETQSVVGSWNARGWQGEATFTFTKDGGLSGSNGYRGTWEQSARKVVFVGRLRGANPSTYEGELDRTGQEIHCTRKDDKNKWIMFVRR